MHRCGSDAAGDMLREENGLIGREGGDGGRGC